MQLHDFNEIKYILSTVIFNMYKNFKNCEIEEINSNPFVNFKQNKIVN